MKIIFLRDHKVGFKLSKKVSKVLSNYISNVSLLTFYNFHKEQLDKDNKNKIVIFVRHPKEIIVSGYLYHKICKEKWTKDNGVNYYDDFLKELPNTDNVKQIISKSKTHDSDKSYQHILNELSQEDGLLYELNNIGRFTLSGLNSILDLNKPNVVFLDMNSYLFNYEETIDKLLNFLNIKDKMFETISYKLKSKTHLFNKRNFNRNIKHITNLNLDRERYKNYWTDKLEQSFNQQYPELMSKYENKIL